jgi:type IV pilus assembly protein PilB
VSVHHLSVEPPRRPRLGDVLLRLGMLDHPALATALEARLATGGGTRLGRVVLDLGLVTEDELARALAVQLVLPLVDLATTPLDPDVARSIPRDLAERELVVAFARRGGRLAVAAVDPSDAVLLSEIRARAGAAALEVHVATESGVRAALASVWDGSAPEPPAATADAELRSSDDAETVQLVDRLLIDAVHARATELLLDPQRDGLHVRIRVDGVLRHLMTLPRTGSSAIVDWLKAMAHLDVDEARLPQEGRAVVLVQGDSVGLRVATIPSAAGEQVVVRLRPASTSLPSLDSLGLSGAQQQVVLDALGRRNGLVLVVGPVGAGRTHTLHALAAGGLEPGRSVVAVEDPAEAAVPGASLLSVDPAAGATYADVLHEALERRPDVVLVGDVGDRDTAPAAVRAAAGEQLVLSTMLAVDAADALVRLVRLGVPAAQVAENVGVVLSQRLVRTPCRECAAGHDPDPYLLATLWVTDPRGTWVEAHGCLACSGTGYRGRTAVVELLEVGPEVRQALVETDDEAAVRTAARAAGTRSMREQAVELARRGGTTLEEIVRAVPDDPDHSS